MKIIMAILLLIICFCNDAKAQEEFVPQPAKLITKFPFIQLTGGIIIIRAQIDTLRDTLNFVFDTGSGGISLDSTTVKEKKFVAVKSDRTIRGIAGMKTVSFTYGHTMKLPGMQVDSLAFHINDYDLLTSVYGIKIDGIMGYSFLRRFIIKIDYDKQLLEIYTPGVFKYPRGG
ncbi:MAG: retropepsin-like domain-containing protein, partial [Chitinophagaceae bacterium]|nr:retropepsin-like domain-containing protein [Chitinophagaceae bacterium]